MQRIVDQLAIEQLLADFAHMQDEQDFAGLVALFDVTGTLEIVGPGEQGVVAKFAGREEIAPAVEILFRDSFLGHLTRTHLTSIRFDTLTSEHALVRCICLITTQTPDDDTPRPSRTGVCVTECRRTPDGWRFSLFQIFGDQRMADSAEIPASAER